MKAHVGDRITLAPPTVSTLPCDGQVLETWGPDGAPPYLLRWSDGHVGLCFPGHGSVLRIEPEEAVAGREEKILPAPVVAGSSPDAQAAPAHERGRVRG
jgi:hypothetical protein